MDGYDITIVVAFSIVLSCAVGIWWIWIHKPGKTFKEGLKDWIRESADDF